MSYLRMVVVAVGWMLLAQPAAASKDRFVDSDEFKDKKYRQGCVITDYRDLVEEEDITWAWVDPAFKVGAPGPIDIRPIRNFSDVTDSAVAPKLEQDFKEAFQRIGKTTGKGGLTLDSCIIWMERFEAGKAFIPYAGGHLMQAGIGIEAVLVDAGGRTVAKIRHSVRGGHEPSAAAGKLVDEVVNYLRDH
jgi:hypothetical protein